MVECFTFTTITTTWDLKIMHDSSLETTAANRIYTNTKADKGGSNGIQHGDFHLRLERESLDHVILGNLKF